MLMSTRSEVALPDEGILKRFDIPGPRYTSYPTADRFVEAFDRNAFAEALRARATGVANSALSLYVHLPFCNTVCYYCGCNKVITKDRSKSAEYAGYIAREADLVLEHLTGNRTIEQLHFGGGTPTFMSNEELEQLMEVLTTRFPLEEKGEFSIEVDPRTTPADKVETLARLGFNRMSVGVQDFNPEVQKAVNRLQSFEMTQETVDAARKHGFRSITSTSSTACPSRTARPSPRRSTRWLVLSPERIALYHYAHLPDRFKPQRRIKLRGRAVVGREDEDHAGRHQAAHRRGLPVHRHGPLRQGVGRPREGAAPGPAAPQLPGLQHASGLRPRRTRRVVDQQDRSDLLAERGGSSRSTTTS